MQMLPLPGRYQRPVNNTGIYQERELCLCGKVFRSHQRIISIITAAIAEIARDKAIARNKFGGKSFRLVFFLFRKDPLVFLTFPPLGKANKIPRTELP